jgi:hypothetical protein
LALVIGRLMVKENLHENCSALCRKHGSPS